MQCGNTRYLSFGFIALPFALDLCVLHEVMKGQENMIAVPVFSFLEGN